MLISMYIPHWERAVVPALIQLLLIGTLWVAMFAYARRWGARLSAILLTVGVVSFPTMWVVIATCCGSGKYDELRRVHWCPDHSDLFLNVVELFELWGFAIFSFVGLILALCLISLVGKWRDSHVPDKINEEATDLPRANRMGS